jgi:hypothetical protein
LFGFVGDGGVMTRRDGGLMYISRRVFIFGDCVERYWFGFDGMGIEKFEAISH